MRRLARICLVFCAFHSGVASAGLAEGIDLFERGQFKDARIELIPDAEKGVMQAMAYLGEMYLSGQGGGRDELKARDYITRAAEEGNIARAQYVLGTMYLSGNLVSRNEAKGVDLVQKAAEVGHSPAQIMLGLWLHRGQYGYTKDTPAALAWFKAAAQQKNPIGMSWLGFYYEEGLGGLSKDPLVSLDWYRKAAELKNADAARHVGRIYLSGVGVQKDQSEAVRWYRRAAVLGNSSSQYLLGTFYENGRAGLPIDLGVAIGWYTMAQSTSGPPDVQQQAKDALQRLNKQLGSDFNEHERRGKLAVLQSFAQTFADINTMNPPSRRGVYGSGVMVGAHGEVITNAHVVRSCDRIRLQPSGEDAKLISKDVKNDLALLRVKNIVNVSPASLRSGKGIRQGDEVVVVGYPLKGILSNTSSVVTSGIVNSLSGLSNDSTSFQISATVQPGSSGGGIWDRGGRLVGLVHARLLSTTPENVQNVNFGIQLANLQAFLASNNIDYQSKLSTDSKLSVSATAEVARRSTVQVECY